MPVTRARGSAVVALLVVLLVWQCAIAAECGRVQPAAGTARCALRDAAPAAGGVEVAAHDSVPSSTGSTDTLRNKTALILGCGGFLGRRLHATLARHGASVWCVRDRTHVDLRRPDEVARLDEDMRQQHFVPDIVFFLACEVGGAKFLSASGRQAAILHHNVLMYEAVFPWLQQRGWRAIFTSSYMRFSAGNAGTGNGYAVVKALGEQWALELPHVRSVRLWNLYGEEPVGEKSHVLSDWAMQALSGRIDSWTTGEEQRQFMHVDDAAASLVALWHGWRTAWRAEHAAHDERVIDVASGTWWRVRDLGQLLCDLAVQHELVSTCDVHVANVSAPPRVDTPPQLHAAFHHEWSTRVAPFLALQEGAKSEDSVALERGTMRIGSVNVAEGLLRLLRYHALTFTHDSGAS